MWSTPNAGPRRPQRPQALAPLESLPRLEAGTRQGSDAALPSGRRPVRGSVESDTGMAMEPQELGGARVSDPAVSSSLPPVPGAGASGSGCSSLPALSSRGGVTAFAPHGGAGLARRRAAPPSGAGARLAPLEHDSSTLASSAAAVPTALSQGGASAGAMPRLKPLEQVPTVVPHDDPLRPSIPWAATEASVPTQHRPSLPPEALEEFAPASDLTWEASAASNGEPQGFGAGGGAYGGRGGTAFASAAGASCVTPEGPTRAEVEKIFRMSWQEDLARGSSPTAAAAEALRRVRSSVSRESACFQATVTPLPAVPEKHSDQMCSSWHSMAQDDLLMQAPMIANSIAQGHEAVRRAVLEFLEIEGQALHPDGSVHSNFTPFEVQSAGAETDDLQRMIVTVTLRRTGGRFSVSYSSTCSNVSGGLSIRSSPAEVYGANDPLSMTAREATQALTEQAVDQWTESESQSRATASDELQGASQHRAPCFNDSQRLLLEQGTLGTPCDTAAP